MITACAFVPSTPLLIPEVASGAASELEDLRRAAIDAVGRAVGSADRVVIIGAGAETRLFIDAVGTMAGFGVPVTVAVRPHGEAISAEPTNQLGVAATLGVWLLDQTTHSGSRSVLEIAIDENQKRIDEIAAEISSSSDSIALVVVADGSAARTEKAPGYLHPDAIAFDVLVEAALTTGDAQALAALDQAQAQAVISSGWPAWHVAGLAMASHDVKASFDRFDATYGVGYFVATWILVS